MNFDRCPFCYRDPFEYVDIGVGRERVAITCCDLGIDLWSRSKTRSAFARRILFLRRSPSPRRKARAQRLLKAYAEGT